ncbi:uncharacterized protein LOC114363665 [Ostrinia furnacalis]|uniref:uncharacterized protein LOC114363665 n=1 Tax=Ostrinia furnacalis TaxID=93504 RepID=UPI00103A5471|nr:uncharacterized protein LOC114363665 [Ostrinia furnacalis]
MAKLHSYFVLCPLIDQKSFLGVSKDKDAEFVIVTLGRNVVNKYRLSDQKQVGGWTSKDHITAAVIYDKDQGAYVGVFNKNIIKIWKEDSDNLDKVKKYKFPLNILKLVPRYGEPALVIFENGNCAALPYALENRKTYESKGQIKDSESIVDVATYSVNNVGHVCYITKDGKDRQEIVVSPLREELGDMEKSKLSKVKITRPDDVYVVGKLINTKDKPTVYILWSDSKMTVYDLLSKSWKSVGSVPWVSTLSTVSLAWMGKNHLIAFGSNTDQDGAIIVAYNTLLGVGSCRYPMKMYTEDARLYCFYDRIILEASNHIGMLPYVLETKRNLSSLLGSHEIVQDECTEIADWGTPTRPIYTASDEIKELLKLGITERAVCSQVVQPYFEKCDSEGIKNVLKEFNDIPESVLVQLLNYTLKLAHYTDACVDDFEKWYNTFSENSKPVKELLDYAFEITFSDALLIPYLRESLNLNDTLFLMSYMSHLLMDSETEFNTDYESKLCDWCILLTDAFYQQFLMTKDEKVTNVLCHTLEVVSSLVQQLDKIDELLPLLNKFVTGRFKPHENEDSLPYTIELMQI